MVVVDLSAKLLEMVVESITQTILDIQMENLIKTFPGKSKEELFNLVKVCTQIFLIGNTQLITTIVF